MKCIGPKTLTSAALLALMTAAWIPAVGNAADKEDDVVTRSQTESLIGVVQEINLGTREVTIQDGNGNVRTMHVGEEARNLDQLRVGDHVRMTYETGMTIAMSPVREGTGTSRADFAAIVERAKKGDLPGGKMVRYTTVVAVVEGLDRKTRLVTLKGPRRTVTVMVQPDVDLDKVKVGDQVVAAFKETLAVKVTRTEEPNDLWR